ncbi:MAG: PHP domain-containing protein [Candidatus Kerfeldbacteria bacterium]|nr:PHP domain-containing protein [Candidatus Kerfeldbacteria bacterium]
MFPYDLQIHTNQSDGDYSLDTVIQKAKRAKLKGVVITDHNVAGTIDANIQAATAAGLSTCGGVEISAKFGGIEVHVLGYARAFARGVLERGLAKTLTGYNVRSQAMVAKINRSGLAHLSFTKIRRRKGSGTCVVKYDIAQVLGPLIHRAPRDAQRLLDRGGPFFIPYGTWAMSPTQAVRLIHRAGGIAVISHPGETQRKMGSINFRKLFAAVRQVGIDGLEVNSSKHSRAERAQFATLARQYQLVVTGGSDWHGEGHHPEIALGSGGLTERQFKAFIKHLE